MIIPNSMLHTHPTINVFGYPLLYGYNNNFVMNAGTLEDIKKLHHDRVSKRNKTYMAEDGSGSIYFEKLNDCLESMIYEKTHPLMWIPQWDLDEVKAEIKHIDSSLELVDIICEESDRSQYYYVFEISTFEFEFPTKQTVSLNQIIPNSPLYVALSRLENYYKKEED